MTSMCSRPKKPTRKPKPSACDFSGSQASAGSLSDSFSSASFRGSYWSPSRGNRPVYTMGLASRYPGSGSSTPPRTAVMVSPTFTWRTSFRPVTR